MIGRFVVLPSPRIRLSAFKVIFPGVIIWAPGTNLIVDVAPEFVIDIAPEQLKSYGCNDVSGLEVLIEI